MKRKKTSRLIIMGMLSMFFLNMTAQVTRFSNSNTNCAKIIPRLSIHKAVTYEETVKVTCKIENVGSDLNYIVISVDNAQYGKAFGDYDKVSSSIVCEVPKGKYDFHSSAILFDKSFSGISWVVKESVEINKDTTLVFDLSEAVNTFDFKIYDPEGNLCKVDVFSYDNTNDLMEKGNAKMIYDAYYLILDGVGPVAVYGTQYNHMTEKTSPTNVQINTISDRYQLYLVRTVANDSVFFVSKQKAPHNTFIIDNPANYAFFEEVFLPTPNTNYLSDKGGGQTEFCIMTAYDNVNIERSGFPSSIIAKDGIAKAYIDNNGDDSDKLDVLVQLGFVDRRDMEIEIEKDEDEDGNIVEFADTMYYDRVTWGMPAMVKKSGTSYICGYRPKMMSDFSYLETGQKCSYSLGHPFFSFTDQQKLLPYGSSSPYNTLVSQGKYVGKRKQLQLYNYYIGLNGELRESDDVFLELELKYNGDVICSDYSQINKKLNSFSREGHTDGIIEGVFTNTNIRVDGLQGKNITKISIDWGKEDFTPPTLQKIQFKDTDNMIIDRFYNSADGNLYFAGGDFELDTNWFSCKEIYAEVSYSPYNEEQWTTLEVEEIPENYYMPGFGYFYRGSLADVQGEAEKGWFDLKIRLTDAAGNWQEQIISPAFRIDDCVATGISETVKPTVPAAKTYFSLDGKRSVTPQKGLNIVRQADGTVRKVTVR